MLLFLFALPFLLRCWCRFSGLVFFLLGRTKTRFGFCCCCCCTGIGLSLSVSVSILKSFILINMFDRENIVFISFIVCWCGGLYRLDNILFRKSIFVVVGTGIDMFEIGLSLALRLGLHLLLYQVQQQHKGLYFVHRLLVRRYLSPRQHSFPWSEVHFCCICTSFEIGLLLVLRLRIHLGIFPPHQQVQQGYYSLLFLHCLLVWWSLLHRKKPTAKWI